ncbi:MAG: glycosyltransferase family 4 protein [Methylococcales bacterium]
MQYIPHLEAMGLEITVEPLFNDAYLSSLYQSKNWLLNRVSNVTSIISSYSKRLYIILNSKRFDVIWLEKELFPFLPSIFESLLSKIGIPYIVDYDDAIFHNYDSHDLKIIRFFLKDKLKSLLANAYAVTAGNAYLADYANRNGAKNIVIIPTVLDIDRYSVTPEPSDEVFRIGWIGSPSSVPCLDIIVESLQRVVQTRKIIFVTIGAEQLNFSGVTTEQHRWSLDTEAKLLESIHVGVMPLSDPLWDRGKCGYKLIQYMACARTVIASPIGVNSEIVTHDVGLLASNEDSWVEAIIKLANQPELRQQLGKAARIRVEKEFTLQVTAPRIAHLLEDAARGQR